MEHGQGRPEAIFVIHKESLSIHRAAVRNQCGMTNWTTLGMSGGAGGIHHDAWRC